METDSNLRVDLGVRQLAARLGLADWQLRLARGHGLIPEPDMNGRWSAELVERCQGDKARIIAAFGDQPPIGAGKAAELLAVRVRLDVERADVEVLVARGELRVVGRYQQYPVYLVHEVEALADRVAEVVAARKGPLLDRVEAKGAALVLGWPKGVFGRIAAERALPTDQLSRYALADVRALAADTDLTARVHAEWHDQAVAQARRNEQRYADTLRKWMLHCSAYLDRAAETPPNPATATRALRALTTARSTVNAQAA
nr:hypothetical protein GCM10010200_085050 [Actinomadura rugatobispora]